MSGLHPPQNPAPARRGLALLATGVAAFTVYGSLVPFTFHAPPDGGAVDAFVRAMTERTRIDSRSDALVNVLLGVPLGFALLGCCRVGTDDRAGDAAAAVFLLPACLAFAGAVEFSQLYVPVRTCSGADVLCQGFGSAVGMFGWVLAGRWLTAQVQDLWSHTSATGPAARLLVAYTGLLAFIQALPLDVSPSPKDVYKKLRDHVPFVPFEEVLDAEGDAAWVAAVRLIRVAGLYLPVGLLAARLPGYFRSFPVLSAAAVGLAGVMEAIQLPIISRVPSATDVVAGAGGVVLGWWVGGRPARGPACVGWGVFWWVGLLLLFWAPFDFSGPGVAFDWLPGMPLEGGNPLNTLEELLTKLILFAPPGILVARVVAPARGYALAAAVGTAASACIEFGQIYLPAHTACVTDVLLGGCGAAAGAWVAGVVVDPQSRTPEVF